MRSCKTADGMPKCHTMLSKNNPATAGASSDPSPTKQGTSFTYLVSLSITVKMALKPPHNGKLVIKSMEYVWKHSGRMGSDCKSLEGSCVESFYAWHTAQLRAKE